jgi:dinuclear metal center YbgI/SA1388 family protein
MVVVRDIISLLNDLAPWRLAEDWDNCGLMVGHMDHPVTKAALALDATLETVTQARDAGAQVLLTHHPLIFKPLKRIDLSQESAKVAASAIEAGIAIISAHTNLDASTVGVARALAQKLELKDVEVLEATRGGFSKLVVFVPLGYENPIRESVLSIGAGRIGQYDGCSFAGPGEGTYQPGPNSTPFRGTAGNFERIRESRLEFLVEDWKVSSAVAAMKSAHPYEEAAYDIYPLANQAADTGFGCIGYLDKALNINELTEILKKRLPLSGLRIAAFSKKPVRIIAIMPGSGGSYIEIAHSRGADVLISGDIGYHQARQAEFLGLSLIDVGHFASEHPALDFLADALGCHAEASGLGFDMQVLSCEKDPWQYVGPE